jgi:hypothetical protein
MAVNEQEFAQAQNVAGHGGRPAMRCPYATIHMRAYHVEPSERSRIGGCCASGKVTTRSRVRALGD